MSEDTFTIKIDGREVECKKGDKVLQVALDNGIHIPHYCWHPGLSIAGNCRMCLCKASINDKPIPKPVITCDTDCVPGMEVDASSDETRKLQEAIMEFLLINHPLDCPVCDQAGECRLQDYAHEYGRSSGRFKEAKRAKPDTVVGPGVALWKQRCIACSRCIRFADEVSGTGELRFVNRGDRVEIETFPGVPLDNPLAGNVVDICPVGALVSRDFLFEARVWNMTRQPSVCPGCSKGCNVYVDALDTKWDDPVVKRLVPRENADVNQWWMCDNGRAEIHALHKSTNAAGEEVARLRALQERVVEEEENEEGETVRTETVSEAIGNDDLQEALALAKEKHRGKIAVIGNLWQTVEELHLVKALADALDAKVALLERPAGEAYEFPKFSIPADKNPNRAGAKLVFGDRDGAADLKAITGGDVEAVILFNSVPAYEPSEELVKVLEGAEMSCVVSLFEDSLTEKASWIVPGTSWAEKDGTYVNQDGRLQRLARSFDSPGNAAADLVWLQRMLAAVSDFEHENVSPAGVFKLAGAAIGALADVSYPGRGSRGAVVGA